MRNTTEGDAFDPIKHTFYSLFFITSLTGNSLIINIVYKNANKKMRTTMNLFVVNMAISDLLTAIIPLPLDMAVNIKGQWPFNRQSIAGLVLCKTISVAWNLQSSVSIYLIIIIGFDRFFAVFFPTRRPVTSRRPSVVLMIIWASCILFVIPFAIGSTVVVVTNKTTCLPKIPKFFPEFNYLFYTFLIILPTITVFALYPAILVKLWRRKIPGNPSTLNQELRERTNRKVTFMATALMISYGISWFPLHFHMIMILIRPSYGSEFGGQIPITFILTYASGALSSIVCIMFNSNFRTALWALFRPLYRPCSVCAKSKRNSACYQIEVFTLAKTRTDPNLKIAPCR